MMAPFNPRVLGRTGLQVSALGIASSYGVGGRDVERAFDHGVNLFLWGSRRRAHFGRGVANLARSQRERMVIGIQSYTRAAWMMRLSVESALRALGTDHVDLLGLAWWNASPPLRILEAARKLRDSGKVRHILVSMHHRPAFESVMADPDYAAIMVRYNAAHPGAEREVFPHLPIDAPPGVIAFTATRWGALLDPRLTPPGLPTPRASDCYRFALSNPSVDACLCGPKDSAELDEALATLARGPMDREELAWMRTVGAGVRESTKGSPRGLGMGLLDRLGRSWCGSETPQLSA
jgi:aryl-alcohol dehydrogenase-like predicted oxidoreductase